MSIAVTVFIFIVLFLCITFNILLGCYAAIHFGLGPPDWKTALNQVIDLPFFQDYWHELRTRVSSWSGFRKNNSSNALANDSHSGTDNKSVLPQTNNNSDQTSADNTELTENSLASGLAQDSKTWFIQEDYIEVSLLKLNIAMKKSGQFASELDWRIRSFRGKITQEDVKQFLNELRDDCRDYLESQASITEQMKLRLDEFGDLKNLAEEIDYANMEQSAQIETTLSNLDHLDLTDNPEEGATRLIKELAGLRFARHHLCDMQDRAFVHIIFNEQREEMIPKRLFIDESFGIYNRVGIEVTLHEWWKQKRYEKEAITFALLDFVRFGEANEEYGITVCDKMIKFFSDRLKERFDQPNLTGLYSGNCFLVAIVNSTPKKAIAEIERFRQWSDKAVLRVNGCAETIRLQLTCAITEALVAQSPNEVLAVLDKTLAAAKKAGRNHTFYYFPGPSEHPPEKIDAPDFGEASTEINIA
ncbi:MAG: GGDEF domain-containing protein [Planctomycetaceae bacterium]|jgi:diguanylate cyclase (GGDEF)-like protein|nr:GGDEF domain-containing protein [Planctomycetaceae bacterium]